MGKEGRGAGPRARNPPATLLFECAMPHTSITPLRLQELGGLGEEGDVRARAPAIQQRLEACAAARAAVRAEAARAAAVDPNALDIDDFISDGGDGD